MARNNRISRVYLVGSGPGDPMLLTRRALQLIESCDAVLYDRLVSDEILSLIPETCHTIYVGKRDDEGGVSQDDINRTLVESAGKYATVLRLKGGDPFLFGRGGEEAQYLRKHSIDFEIVPGITSPLSVPAYAGIPVTHRSESSELHIFTGHGKNSDLPFDLEKAGKLDGTLIFLMAMKNLELICNGLIANGKSPKTKIAIIQNGTRPNMRILTSTLQRVVEDVKQSSMKPPCIVVIGEVVKYAGIINWFQNGSLHGTRVLVTRAKKQSQDFVQLLKAAGADSVCEPFIDIVATGDRRLFEENSFGFQQNYDFILFNSTNGAEYFFESLFAEGYDLRKLAACQIGVVGEGTAAVLKKYHIQPDFMPQKYSVKELLQVTAERAKGKNRVLVITSNLSPVDESEVHKEFGLYVTKAILYKTIERTVDVDRIQSLLADSIDYITVMSSSTARAIDASGKQLDEDSLQAFRKMKICAIGPETAHTLKKLGYTNVITADTYTMKGMIEEIQRDYETGDAHA